MTEQSPGGEKTQKREEMSENSSLNLKLIYFFSAYESIENMGSRFTGKIDSFYQQNSRLRKPIIIDQKITAQIYKFFTGTKLVAQDEISMKINARIRKNMKRQQLEMSGKDAYRSTLALLTLLEFFSDKSSKISRSCSNHSSSYLMNGVARMSEVPRIK